MKLTIAVTPAEHQEFTNAWKNAIGYAEKGTHIADRARIIAAARKVYKDYPKNPKEPWPVRGNRSARVGRAFGQQSSPKNSAGR